MLRRAQVMHQADQRVGVGTAIGPQQGRVVEFVLDDQVQAGRQTEAQVVGQVFGVVSPGERDDPNLVALGAQVLTNRRS